MTANRFRVPCTGRTRWPALRHARLVAGLLWAPFFALISACVPGGDSSIGTTESDGDCTAIEPSNLFTDFEDGTGNIYPAEGRIGLWYTFNDGTGDQFPPDKWSQVIPSRTGVCGSRFGLMTKARNFKDWSAGLSADFRAIDGQKNPYDASRYSGISFWMKVNIPADAPQVSSMPVRFGLLDKDTAPEGKICTAYNHDNNNACNDKHGKNIFAQNEWKKYDVLFSDLQQEGWGQPQADLAVNALYSIQIQAQRLSDFDLWIDNVAFMPSEQSND